MAKQTTFSDQLRAAIRHSEKTRYLIAAETGIAQSTLSKFMHGKGGLSVEGIDLICKSIGARLTVDADAGQSNRAIRKGR
jgi:hypothetical protein